MPKSLSQHGTRHTDFIRQGGDCPGLSRQLMQECQGLSHIRVPHAGQPARLRRRQFLDVPPQRFYEQHFGQFGDDGGAAWACCLSVIDGISKVVFQPLSRWAVPYMDLDDRGESGQEDLTELQVAGQVAADQFGEFSSTSKLRDHTSFGQHRSKECRTVDRCDGRSVAHQVRIAVRGHYNIAGFKGYCPAVFLGTNVTSSFGDHVKDNDVFWRDWEIRCYCTSVGLACTPGRREFAIEEHRAVQFYVFQDFREHVHIDCYK